VAGVFGLALTFRSGERAGERSTWLLGGIVSVALGIVLYIRPDIGAESLAVMLGCSASRSVSPRWFCRPKPTNSAPKAAQWLPTPG
jgi:hypothetical protein